MTKNIVVLSDGTGNSAAKANRTNIWRLYQALDKSQPREQLVFYDDGVGTAGGRIQRILGGALGIGLKQNVVELYDLVSRAYRDGDRIYLFGFSRGAYTVRLLAALIGKRGLVQAHEDASPSERRAAARAAYDAYRAGFGTAWLQRPFAEKDPPEGTPPDFDIEFIGVWDSVDAYGFPNDKIAEFWHKAVYPIYFPDRKLSQKVKRACQALAIDDERHTFHPLLWTEEGGDDRIDQVWFAGMHSDVGGGYFRSGLAHISLDWMLDQVAKTNDGKGLNFVAADLLRLKSEATAFGEMHNSRRSMAAFYRYGPRDIDALSKDADVDVEVKTPKIHCSVFARIESVTAPYAPLGLPLRYQIEPPEPPEPREDDAAREARATVMPALKQLIMKRRRLYWLFVAYPPLVIVLGLLLAADPETADLGLVGRVVAWPFELLNLPVLAVIRDWTLGYLSHWYCLFAVAGLGVALQRYRRKLVQETERLAHRAWAQVRRGAR